MEGERTMEAAMSAQFLARALQPGHPSHYVVNLPPGPRKMKDTLSSKVGNLMEPYLQDGVIPAGAYKETIGKIHTKLLGTPTLVKLRTGF